MESELADYDRIKDCAFERAKFYNIPGTLVLYKQSKTLDSGAGTAGFSWEEARSMSMRFTGLQNKSVVCRHTFASPAPKAPSQLKAIPKVIQENEDFCFRINVVGLVVLLGTASTALFDAFAGKSKKGGL